MTEEAGVRLRKRINQILERHPDLCAVKDFHEVWMSWTPRTEAAYWELQDLRHELAHIDQRATA